MDFDSVAKRIVSDSICSAICIDNAFSEPYTHTENPEDLNFKTPKELYESFREQNCVMDIYKYVDFESWESKRESILKNKDLLILDWELLPKGDPPFKDALEILLEAVKKDSLPFIYIYTQEIDLDKVVLNISSYFSGNSLEELRGKYESLCDRLEDLQEVENADELLRNMKKKFRKIVIGREKVRAIKGDIFNHFKKALESDNIGNFHEKFFNIGKEVLECENDSKLLRSLALLLYNGYFRKTPVPEIDIRSIEDEKYVYLIHNTLVKISTKRIPTTEYRTDVVSPKEVFSEFSKTVWKRPQNFLALLGLEMRNLYRDSSSVIGKDINEIDENAFFYRQELLESEEKDRFHEFLKNIWKEEVSSFLLEQEPLLFSVLDDYKAKNEINEKIKSLDRSSLLGPLSELNYYYSIIRSKQRNSRKIRFGDIFSIEYNKEEMQSSENNKADEENASNNDYLFYLCITSKCDCIRPNKIKNSLYFVGGNKIGLSEGLKEGDSGFISFVKEKKKTICIKWNLTPFTIHIPIKDNEINRPIKCIFAGKKIILNHLTFQKEDYTQRIANESFRWANRVGIDFAKIDQDGGERR